MTAQARIFYFILFLLFVLSSEFRLASKVSGWQSLRSLAAGGGTSLSPDFVTRLVKTHGVRPEKLHIDDIRSAHRPFFFTKMLVIPKHFLPPIVVNTALGTVLWAAYSESSSALSSYDGLEAHPITIAALSGAVAGGAQAIVAAPAENLRLAIERSTTGGDWSHAWREMLRGRAQNHQPIRVDSLHEAKQVRGWMMDVRDMAGRGWKGWGWGLAKDVCGEQPGLSPHSFFA
jgi:hypothetical protein